MTRSPHLLRIALFAATFAAATAYAATPDPAKTRTYIDKAWTTLTRSQDQCNALTDPKIVGHPVLYVPAEMKVPPALADIGKRCGVDIHPLPRVIQQLGDIDATSANDDSSTRLKRGRDSELDTTASMGRIDWTSNGGLTVAMRALIAPAMASVGSDERTISEGTNTSGCCANGTNTAGADGSATELSRTSPLTPTMVLTGPNS